MAANLSLPSQLFKASRLNVSSNLLRFFGAITLVDFVAVDESSSLSTNSKQPHTQSGIDEKPIDVTSTFEALSGTGRHANGWGDAIEGSDRKDTLAKLKSLFATASKFNWDADVGQQAGLKIQARTSNEDPPVIGREAERILPDTYRAPASRLVYRTLNSNRHLGVIKQLTGRMELKPHFWSSFQVGEGEVPPLLWMTESVKAKPLRRRYAQHVSV